MVTRLPYSLSMELATAIQSKRNNRSRHEVLFQIFNSGSPKRDLNRRANTKEMMMMITCTYTVPYTDLPSGLFVYMEGCFDSSYNEAGHTIQRMTTIIIIIIRVVDLVFFCEKTSDTNKRAHCGWNLLTKQLRREKTQFLIY